jgi:hypothetical protein
LSLREPTEQPYDHLVVVAESDYGRTYPGGVNFIDKPSRDWGKFSKTLSRDELFYFRKHAKYHQVRATQEAIDISIAKCDVPSVVPPTDEVLLHALNLTVHALSYTRGALPLSPTELWDFKLNSSAGLPYSKQGLKTKAEVIQNHSELLISRALDLSEIPIDTYNDKQEFLTEEELSRNKVRGVFSTSLHHLLRERLVYGAQNRAILEGHENRWIQYGMVKQYGGFDRCIKPIEKFQYKDEGDVSGWDRVAPLTFVYIIRNRLLPELSGHLANVRDYVSFHNVVTHVLLPNGKIVRRKTGANSGRSNTTTDNSILHLLIVVYIFVRRSFHLGKSVTIVTIMRYAVYRIYSDDKLGSVDLEFWEFSGPDEFMDFAIDTYGLFGMTIKKSATFYTFCFKGERIDPRHSFLGSYVSYHAGYGMYLPLPRLDKICSSIVYLDQKQLEPPEFFAKLVSLAELSVANSFVFGVIFKFINWYYLQNCDLYGPTFDTFLSTKNLRFDDPGNYTQILTGFESFLLKAEVGFKDLIMKTSPNQKPKSAKKKPVKNQVRPAKVQDVKGNVQAVYKIPHCAMDYLSSLAAPFETPGGVCIPAEVFPLPSQKIKTFIKGRFQTGTTGLGFLIASPCVTNAGTCLSFTQSTSVGTPATTFNNYTNVLTAVNAQFPFDETTRAAGGFHSRIVSYGMRVKYIGKLMDRNGVTTAYEEPDHGNCYTSAASPRTTDEINGNPQSTLVRVGGERWDNELYYSGPVQPDEVEFQNSAYPLGQYISVITVEGEPGDSYEYEYVQHTEVIGRLAVSKTPSHSDPAAFGKVLEASKSTSTDGPLNSSNSPSFFSKFMELARTLGPTIVSGGRMVASMLSGNIPSGLLEAANTQKRLSDAFRVLSPPQRAIAGAPQRLAIGM